MTARLHEIDNLRSEFERRLEEKDNMIRNLQDRIQSYLYDRNGEPWTKVQRPHRFQALNSEFVFLCHVQC
jgi:hypothetical protein